MFIVSDYKLTKQCIKCRHSLLLAPESIFSALLIIPSTHPRIPTKNKSKTHRCVIFSFFLVTQTPHISRIMNTNNNSNSQEHPSQVKTSSAVVVPKTTNNHNNNNNNKNNPYSLVMKTTLIHHTDIATRNPSCPSSTSVSAASSRRPSITSHQQTTTTNNNNTAQAQPAPPPPAAAQRPPSLGIENSSLRVPVGLNLETMAAMHSIIGPDSVPARLLPLHGRRPPAIGIVPYVNRVCRYMRCSAEALVIAVVYIDRLVRKREYCGCLVTPTSAHRVFFAAMLCAVKYHDDIYYSMSFYASLCGVPRSEVYMMESVFLSMLDYSLFVSAAEYVGALRALVDHPAYVPCDDDDTAYLAETLATRAAAAAVVPPQICCHDDGGNEAPGSPAERLVQRLKDAVQHQQQLMSGNTQ
eukprot:PhM_4_TR11580/c0_g1_i1/m.81971